MHWIYNSNNKVILKNEQTNKKQNKQTKIIYKHDAKAVMT